MSVVGNITIGHCFPPWGDDCLWNEGLEVRKEVSQTVKLSRACEVTVVSQLLIMRPSKAWRACVLAFIRSPAREGYTSVKDFQCCGAYNMRPLGS